MTIILGSLLSLVSEGLKEKQAEERAFEKQKFILGAALGSEKINAMPKEEVVAFYNKVVSNLVINSKGEKIEGINADEVNINKEYKKLKANPDAMNLPIYLIAKEDNPKVINKYVIPMYGFGLWDNIWGFLALQADLNTIQGLVLDHKGETPGLGARITSDKIQNRYEEKKVFNEQMELFSVTMQKGEGNDYSKDPHKVDGMSGATLTGNGVNEMMVNYLNLYLPYIQSKK